MMVLVYSPSIISANEIQKAVDIIKDRFSIFFIGDNNVFLSTQTSQESVTTSIK